MQNLRDIVGKYYELVDQGDLDEMYTLFSEEIHYNRGGLVIDGMEEFMSFYRSKRDLHGRHQIDRVIVEGNTVGVQGIFVGQGEADRSFGFSDFFEFDEDKIRKRRTYADMPGI